MTFGEKLRNARKLKKLTQKQLANLTNAKHNSVSDWENNKSRPDTNTIIQLCEVLDISPDYLLIQDSNAFSGEEQELIKKFRALDVRGKETVKCVIDKEYSTTVNYFYEPKRAREYLESIPYLAAFNRNDSFSDNQILQIANAISSFRNKQDGR
ncbi:MAG: helix-turn-helix transcriptional regulator [Lachnospiraceae bacterium]|nr:helix-turn-helix transcriptional regulator [Lachnospiraceae bacterium]